MADALKVLGQAVPAASTLTALYTVPGATSATASTLYACNSGSIAAKFRVSIAVGGAADETKQYIYYDARLAPNESFAATVGITLATTDVVRCQSDTGYVSFSLFGVEVT